MCTVANGKGHRSYKLSFRMIAVVSWPNLLRFSLFSVSVLRCRPSRCCWLERNDVVHSMLYKKQMVLFYFTTNCDFSWLLKWSFILPKSICVIHGSIQTGSNIYFSASLTTVQFFSIIRPDEAHWKGQVFRCLSEKKHIYRYNQDGTLFGPLPHSWVLCSSAWPQY